MVLESAEIEVYYLSVPYEDTLWAVATVGTDYPEFNEYGKLSFFLSYEQAKALDLDINTPNNKRTLLKDVKFSFPGINPKSPDKVITNWYLSDSSIDANIERLSGDRLKVDYSNSVKLGPCKVVNIENWWIDIGEDYLEGYRITLEKVDNTTVSTKSKSFINKKLL